MNIEKTDSEIKAEFENKKVKYDREKWSNLENYLSSNGVVKLPEWKIDLVTKHGVDLNELQS